jgi:hypothetical protein
MTRTAPAGYALRAALVGGSELLLAPGFQPLADVGSAALALLGKEGGCRCAASVFGLRDPIGNAGKLISTR